MIDPLLQFCLVRFWCSEINWKSWHLDCGLYLAQVLPSRCILAVSRTLQKIESPILLEIRDLETVEGHSEMHHGLKSGSHASVWLQQSALCSLVPFEIQTITIYELILELHFTGVKVL